MPISIARSQSRAGHEAPRAHTEQRVLEDPQIAVAIERAACRRPGPWRSHHNRDFSLRRHSLDGSAGVIGNIDISVASHPNPHHSMALRTVRMNERRRTELFRHRPDRTARKYLDDVQ